MEELTCEVSMEWLNEHERIIYNQALEDISKKIKWQYKNYKSMPSIHLFLEIVEQLKK